MKKETILNVRWTSNEGALAKIKDCGHQVVFAFLNVDGEHLTIHRQDDGMFLLTHRSKNKPLRPVDEQKIESARSIGWRNPERHGQYYLHQPLTTKESLLNSGAVVFEYSGRQSQASDFSSHECWFLTLYGLSVLDTKYPIPEKYEKLDKISLDVDLYLCNTYGF